MLVGRRMATLQELQSVYGYEDALNLAEITAVNAYNEWLAYKNMEKK